MVECRGDSLAAQAAGGCDTTLGLAGCGVLRYLKKRIPIDANNGQWTNADTEYQINNFNLAHCPFAAVAYQNLLTWYEAYRKQGK